MPKSLLHFLLLFLLLQCWAWVEGVSIGSGELGVIEAARVSQWDDEFMMDSESSRRVLLMRRRYISYDTLRRDLVPCDRPGASYYNCKAPGIANSYNRGCEIITRCARGY